MRDLDLGVIGNCQVAVLIDSLGRFVWGSLPRLDSDPIFCSLVDGDREHCERGFLDVQLSGFASSEQHYVDNTAILTTTLRNRSGGDGRITDFAPRYRQYGRSFHPAMVVRTITPLAGSPAIHIRLRRWPRSLRNARLHSKSRSAW